MKTTRPANPRLQLQSAAVLYSTDQNGDLFFEFDNSGVNGGWQNLWVDKLAVIGDLRQREFRDVVS